MTMFSVTQEQRELFEQSEMAGDPLCMAVIEATTPFEIWQAMVALDDSDPDALGKLEVVLTEIL